MSFDFNHKFWVGTKKDIQQLIKKQNVLKKLEPISSPPMTYKLFSELYILYVELVNKLGYVYQHTFQVQKRNIIRPLVESATRRLLELKEELKNLEFSEYVYSDKALIPKKLTPFDLVIWRSPNFLYRRPPEIQNIIYENKIFMTDEEKEDISEQQLLKIKDAILLIQSHERARKGRVYKAAINYDKKKFMKKSERTKVNYSFSHTTDAAMSIPVKRTIYKANYIKTDEACRDLLGAEMETKLMRETNAGIELMNKLNNAARVIQRAWRAHKNRKIFKKKLIFKETTLGLRIKRKIVKPNSYADAVIETYKNELLKKKLDDDFYKLITDERTRLLQERTPWIMEDISDHIRAWFKEFYDKLGDFHPFPDALKTGTVLVLIDETMTPIEYSDVLLLKKLSKEEKKKRADKIKQEKQKIKDKLKKEKIAEAKRRKKMKDSGTYDIGEQLRTNKNIQLMESTMKKYSVEWRLIDEYLNKNHEAIKEWVTEEELATIHVELRALVDQFMRIEYELLRRALAADLKKKYKPSKIKKPKQKKGKKKKVEKDITADRTIESLYDELKVAGIIESYKSKNFTDFIADFNFVADDTRDTDNLTTLGPAKGDIKMVVQDCMLGMGEFNVDKPKSVCLVGPLNNGKKLLCNIIASELDAVFMNLSPEKTAAFSEDLPYLLHVIMKVARAFQPTILFIEDVHRLFWKKIPKGLEDLKPRLLQNAIIKKILKPIKKEDKIMVLGTSDTPWAAKAKLKKAFQKILLVPKSDYGTSFLIWMELLSEFADEDNVDDYVISVMAKVLQSYTTGDICNNVAETLDFNRRMRLKTVPLQPSEFLDYFLNSLQPQFPPEDKLLEKFNKWFNNANKLSKLRKKFQNRNAKNKKGKKK